MSDLERQRIEQAYVDGSAEGSPIDRDGMRLAHLPSEFGPVTGLRFCIVCDEQWPCPTRRGLDHGDGEPFDPLTESTLRAAISAASDLTNPRLSEIDWGAVAAALSYMTGVPEPGSRWAKPDQYPPLDVGPYVITNYGPEETPEQTHSPEYNRGWATGNASALDACNPIIDRQGAIIAEVHRRHHYNAPFGGCEECRTLLAAEP